MPFFILAIALSAILIFLVQPLMGKFLLPWFGGGASIWSVVLAFFQTSLLAGYVYASLLSLIRSRTLQVVVHLLLLVSAVIFFTPAIPDPVSSGSDMPEVRILFTLLATVGLPYILLSSTGPLLQAWYYGWKSDSQPWFLFAISNLGSMVGLLIFPFILEPNFGATSIAWGWSAGFMLFVASVLICGVLFRNSGDTADQRLQATFAGVLSIPIKTMATWVVLAAIPSSLLVTTTAQITREIAATSLYWVLPLAVYLGSLILAFADRASFHRSASLFSIAACSLALLFITSALGVPPMLTLLMASALLFLLCLIFHGKLYEHRPDPAFLTAFYVLVSLGGAIGGILFSLVLPMAVPIPIEFTVLCVSLAVVSAYLIVRQSSSMNAFKRFAISIAIGGSVVLAFQGPVGRFSGAIDYERTFFGTTIVSANADETQLRMYNGRTLHGLQPLGIDVNEIRGFSYYGTGSGFYIGWSLLDGSAPKRVGVVGTGAGVIAGFAGQGDVMDFLEIDQAVVRLAEENFDYFSVARRRGATINHLIGDGRILLSDSSDLYDLLVIDAFSSDSVPVHLMTREAIELYLTRLSDKGILLVNISNRYLDLSGVIKKHAQDLDLEFRIIRADPDNSFENASIWAMLSTDKGRFESITSNVEPGRPVLWTDRYSSILPVVRK